MTPKAGPIHVGHITKDAIVGSGIVVVLVVCVFYDIVFLGKTLRVSNTIGTALPTGHFDYPGGRPKYIPVIDVTPALLEEPYLRFKEQSLAQGVVPLWNPHQAGGHPFIATPVSSLLFLPEVILYALPSPYDWDVYLLFRLCVAGLFTFLLMRTLHFDVLPSVVAAGCYMFSGPVLSFVTGVNLNVDILVPLLLLVIEWIIRRDSMWYVVIGSLVVFQVVAGGHPEPAFLVFLAGFVYAVFRLATEARAYPLRTVARNLVTMVVAGIGLGGVVVVPAAEFVFRTSWHTHASAAGLEFDGLERAITILFPWYYSRELVSYPSATGHTWPGGWIGLIPMWLAVFVLWAKDNRRRISSIFLVLVGFGLAKIYGLPVVNWVGHLPIFELIRFPLHMTRPVAFGIAILCGIAVSNLMANADNVKRFFLSVIPLAGCGLAAMWFYPPTNSFGSVFGLSGSLVAVIVVAGFLWREALLSQRGFGVMVVAALFVELFFLVPRERSQRAEAFQEPPYVRFLKSDREPHRVYGIGGALNPNTATAFGVDDIGIYEGLIVKRFAEYVHHLIDPRRFDVGSFNAFRGGIPDPGNRFLDLLNLKYLIVPRHRSLSSELAAFFALRLVYDGEVKVYERLNAFPRVTIRHRVDVIPDGGETLQRLAGGYDLERRVIVNQMGTPGFAETVVPVTESSSVKAVEFKANEKTVLVDMAQDGIVVINDVNYPGWRVRVDGSARELLTANYLFQAVVVPKGEHRITLQFRPGSLAIGVALSMLSAGFLVALIVRERHRRRLTAVRGA